MPATIRASATALPSLAPHEAQRAVPPGCDSGSNSLVENQLNKLRQYTSGSQLG